jgi:hypothetical protein
MSVYLSVCLCLSVSLSVCLSLSLAVSLNKKFPAAEEAALILFKSTFIQIQMNKLFCFFRVASSPLRIRFNLSLRRILRLGRLPDQQRR